MSANYRSKLYHKSILLKPANTQLFEIFCHNNSVYSFLCWQSREITIRPTLKWLAKFKRGLTRFRTWSHTRWWCFCFFINFFFFMMGVWHTYVLTRALKPRLAVDRDSKGASGRDMTWSESQMALRFLKIPWSRTAELGAGSSTPHLPAFTLPNPHPSKN